MAVNRSHDFLTKILFDRDRTSKDRERLPICQQACFVFHITISIFMTKSVFTISFLIILTIGCAPQPHSSGITVTDVISETEIVSAIESSFGSAERDSSGKIVGVDLAKDRTSASDEVLRQVLKLPDLKRLRLAGGNTLPETFAGISKQKSLEELYLQDLPINGEELETVSSALPKLQRLTLRRLTNVSDIARLPALRNLALIEMNVTPKTFRSIIEQKTITALDIRNCSGLTPDDYRNLKSLDRLADLKIGEFCRRSGCYAGNKKLEQLL
jgi:hypothetical protein